MIYAGYKVAWRVLMNKEIFLEQKENFSVQKAYNQFSRFLYTLGFRSGNDLWQSDKLPLAWKTVNYYKWCLLIIPNPIIRISRIWNGANVMHRLKSLPQAGTCSLQVRYILSIIQNITLRHNPCSIECV